MSLMLIAAAALAVSHETTVEHRGAPVAVEYVAEARTRLKTVGQGSPARAGMATCRWTATVAVNRRAAGLETRLPDVLELEGQRPGDCIAARAAVADDIAARSMAVRAHLAAAAAADRPRLQADLLR